MSENIRKDVSKMNGQLKSLCCAIKELGADSSSEGLATEATLVSVLAAINNSNQDLEIILVRDGNGDIIQQITELVTGTVTYKDVNGVVIAVPVAPLEYQDASAVLNLMLAELLTLNTTDFATEATLASILLDTNSIAGEDFATEVTLAALLVAFNSEDFATETTLSLLEGKDFATETTLAALATTDFATETTLADLNSKFNTLGQKVSADSHPVVLSTEQEAILTAIEGYVKGTLNLLTANFDVSTADLLIVLEAIKQNTDSLDVDLSTRASEATLAAAKSVLDDILTRVSLINTDTTNIAASTNVLATPVTGVATSLLVVTGAGAATVAAGKRTISFLNSGNADTTVNGSTLARGVGITYPELSNRDVYGAIPYDALTSELTITTVG